METTESLSRSIESTRDLRSVVKTMKALAAAKIRQYQRAAESVAAYNRTVELGLRVLLRQKPTVEMTPSPAGDRPGAVVFGSDQGMCGQLNDQVMTHALDGMQSRRSDASSWVVASVGERMTGRLEASGRRVLHSLNQPGSVEGIKAKVQDLILLLDHWLDARGVQSVDLFYARPLSGASYEPRRIRMLPLDGAWLDALAEKRWPTKMLPQFSMERDRLFSGLVHQYLFVSLFRAFAESLASENASRLASMQGAERNIEERLSVLKGKYHRQRQMGITEELLDIVSGFELLKEAP
jgi:F-type H+-transporting ATPase subunit gamma